MMTYPHLEVLFGAYFHQDWDVIADDWFGVVQAFAQGEPKTSIQGAANELRYLLATREDDQQLREVLATLGCSYMPSEGTSIRDWLLQVSERLTSLSTAS